MKRPSYILSVIVLSQFAGTSLWFLGNAILPDLQLKLNLGNSAIGNITSIVQFGFISGTLVFAIMAIADRFSPSKVFFISTILAALSNICLLWFVNDRTSLLLFRFFTGFFLAGIYPVGMKIAADWYEKGLGKALGWLVGALVLGTAFPHLLKGLSYRFSAEAIIIFTSLFAFAGGLLIFLFVGDGPYRKKGQSFHPRQIVHIFRSKDFRSSALGYFGHMWELYAFWTFVPVLLSFHPKHDQINISLWSFGIIGIGALSCVLGGYLSQKWGNAKVAFYSLLISGACCFISLIAFDASKEIFLLFILIWGSAVISDSPQFSALVASTTPAESKGTALTFVTCIGFSITIASIELLNYLSSHYTSRGIFMLLGIGPVIGLLFLKRMIKS